MYHLTDKVNRNVNSLGTCTRYLSPNIPWGPVQGTCHLTFPGDLYKVLVT